MIQLVLVYSLIKVTLTWAEISGKCRKAERGKSEENRERFNTTFTSSRNSKWGI